MENEKPDYLDTDWTALIQDRLKKWEKMKQELRQESTLECDIWEEKEPFHTHNDGFKGRLYILPVHKEKRGIFIVCAGGGFKFKSANEAKPVAEYFHRTGINTAILDYNVDSSNTPMNMDFKVQDAAGEDALRAIRYLRYHAEELGILPDKIAIGGFSAGGMVSSIAATRYDSGKEEAEDVLERVSSRPDAVLVLYGAMSVTKENSFLGYNGDLQREMAARDCLKNLKADCPPFFLFQTHADNPKNVLNFAYEFAERGIPYEVHTFVEGPHGGALYDGNHEDSPSFPHTAHWAELAAEWLKGYGF